MAAKSKGHSRNATSGSTLARRSKALCEIEQEESHDRQQIIWLVERSEGSAKVGTGTATTQGARQGNSAFEARKNATLSPVKATK
jgi:hypothetical protein